MSLQRKHMENKVRVDIGHYHTDIFYDPHIRMWTLLVKDENDYQMGAAAYDSTRPSHAEAAVWLESRIREMNS